MSAASDVIRNLSVEEAPICDYPHASADPSPCTSTSIGGGLMGAASAFSQPLGGINFIREESLWVVILLTDGAANASVQDPASGNVNFHCPPTTWPPTSPWPPTTPACRDSSAQTRHSILAGGKNNPDNSYDPDNYDTDDFAHDMADLVACPTKFDPLDTEFDDWCLDSLNYAAGEGGQHALIFTIGLGPLVTDTNLGDPDAGERLIRYVAGVGADAKPDPGFPGSPDDCVGVPIGQDCGNYFFAPSGAQLIQIFEEIASRIFTRLTQ
jgi:hypothetical protein